MVCGEDDIGRTGATSACRGEGNGDRVAFRGGGCNEGDPETTKGCRHQGYQACVALIDELEHLPMSLLVRCQWMPASQASLASRFAELANVGLNNKLQK